MRVEDLKGKIFDYVRLAEDGKLYHGEELDLKVLKSWTKEEPTKEIYIGYGKIERLEDWKLLLEDDVKDIENIKEIIPFSIGNTLLDNTLILRNTVNDIIRYLKSEYKEIK